MRHLLLEENTSVTMGKTYPLYAYLPYSKGVKRFRLHAYISKVANKYYINFENRNYVIKVVYVKDLKKSHVTNLTKQKIPVYTLERLRWNQFMMKR